MKMNIGKLRTLLKLPPPKEGGKPLTEEQKRKRAGYIVYPVLVLLCAGCVWLALSPSEKEQAKAGQGNGFNTEIPLPEDSRMQESKVAAYEHEEMEKKEKERRSTYREMASLLDRKQADTVRLPDLPPEKPRKTAGQETARSPSAAYRDMNRTLNNFYEPAYDREKEELRKRVAELERRQAQQPEASPEYSMEEKLALMEKSYELAARYNGGQTAQVRPATERRKAEARPVTAVRHQVVSSLPRPSDDLERAAAFAGERNTGFHTPVGKTLASARNTIAACVHGTQTVADGQTLRIRLLEPMAVDDRLIPKGTVLTGGTRMQGERLDILISTVEHDGSVIPVELEVYDADGQQGIAVPNSMEYDALREIAANMGGSMNSSINISTDAGAQIASDLGKGVIRGVSQYVTQKMQRVKVTLKAGHRVLLYPSGQ